LYCHFPDYHVYRIPFGSCYELTVIWLIWVLMDTRSTTILIYDAYIRKREH